MKKIKLIVFVCILGMFAFIPSTFMYANEFEGNEQYWQDKCSTSQKTEEGKAQCEAFREYYVQKRESLNGELSSITSQVNSLKSNIANVSNVIKDINAKIEFYDKSIEVNNANIRTIGEQIQTLDVEIEKKQVEIDKRNNLIKSRMKNEQAQLGTNTNVEIIMGANDLVDMIRKVDGLQKITESDQEEVKTIKAEKRKLDLDKNEKERLKQEAETKKAENEESKKNQEALKAEQEKLLSIYQQQEAQLAEKMRAVEVDISTIRNNIIAITNPSDLDFSGNSGFILPVQNGYVSAGTWYYPGGGVHLGMDIAASIGSPVYAPADAVVLYANNPVGTNSGYLGNWSGYPAGGGNTIEILTQVNGTTYAISFFHLSREGFQVRAGQSVAAGQVIALVGNSGNTSGPHTHIEVFNLGSMSIPDAISRFQSTADFSWGNGWGNGALNNTCSVKGPPCRMRPESVF